MSIAFIYKAVDLRRFVYYAYSSNMRLLKQYALSHDRVVEVNMWQGLTIVTLKEKNSDVKCVEFTPNRYMVVSQPHSF